MVRKTYPIYPAGMQLQQCLYRNLTVTCQGEVWVSFSLIILPLLTNSSTTLVSLAIFIVCTLNKGTLIK